MSNSISIAMCTYNGEKYLAEQLESIISSTVQPNEIVICDDCSKDRSIEVAQSVLRSWSGNVTIVRNERNLGFQKNFQKAIGLCNGDIIFLSDQDDIWRKDKIGKLINIFNTQNDVIMVFHDAELVDAQLRTIANSFWNTMCFDYTKFINANYDVLFDHNVVQGSACAFKRELFDCALPFCEIAWHDEWLALVAITKGRIVPLPEKLLLYRQTGNNVIGAGDRSIVKKIKRYINEMQITMMAHYSALVRRHSVLCSFKNKVDNFPPMGEKYISYLQKRIASIEGKDVLQIPWNLYCSLERTNVYGIKEMVKDLLGYCFLKEIK